MKKLFALSLGILGLAALTSCEKQADGSGMDKPESLKSASRIIEAQLDYDPAVTMEAIASIKFQAGKVPSDYGPRPDYEAPNLGVFSVQEVIYFLEATCNYDADQTLVWSNKRSVHRTAFSVPLGDGSTDKIDQDDVVVAYKNLYTEIENHTPAGMKAFHCNIWGTAVTGDQVNLEMKVTYLPQEEEEQIVPLGPPDIWRAFGGWGKCFSGGPGDATTRLNELVNWYGVEAWNGSSSSSTGGWVTVCSNGWPGTVINSVSYPSNDPYLENDDPSVWPITSCANDMCLNQSQMENQLVTFFNYTSANILTGAYQDYLMISAEWTNMYFTPQNANEFCYSYGLDQHRHQISWEIGQYECEPLPW